MALSKTRKRQAYLQFSWQRGFIFFSLFLVLLLSFLSANKVKDTNEFPVRQVKVYGAKNLDQAELQQLLMPLVSKGFFSVEVEYIKDQILQLPWITDVSVRRVWPDQVIIAVTERNPVAYWNKTSLLSSSGEIFSPKENTFPTGLPHFIGPDGEQIHMLEFYSKIDHSLRPLHLKITQLELTPYFSWNLMFASGMKVHVGYKDVLTRINHFVKVYPKIVGERATDVDYIDLRYPNGLAVRWKTVS